MTIEGGTSVLKTCIAEYDFAVDGGAIGTLSLRSHPSSALGNTIPNGSVILAGYVNVVTAPTSGGAGTLGVNSEAAGDIVAPVVVSGAPWSTTGRKSVIPAFTGASSVLTTADRHVAITIGTAALTAGKFTVVVLYV